MATINREFFVTQYRDEVNDHIRRITERLFQLEEQPGNPEQIIEEIFRTAHTMKGSSRMMGYADVSALAHKMEDLLVEIRDGHLELHAKIIDLLFYCLDTINYLVEGVAKNVKRTTDMEQFSRLFAEHAGVSPHDYLRGMRLSIATTALASGQSVTQAAQLAGFGTDTQLRRAWRAAGHVGWPSHLARGAQAR